MNRLKSLNFMTSLTSLSILGVISTFFTSIITESIGVPLDVNLFELIKQTVAGNLEYIVTFTVPSITNLYLKIRQKYLNNELDWRKIFKSKNFLTFLLTAVVGLITIISGIVFPENIGSELTSAIWSGNITLIILAVVMQVINPIIHFIQDPKGKGSK